MLEKDMNKQEIYKKQVGGSHYKNYKIQPFEFIDKNKLSYFSGNIIKYVVRTDVNIKDVQDWANGKYETPDCETYKGKGLSPEQQEVLNELLANALKDLNKIIHYCEMKKENIIHSNNLKKKYKSFLIKNLALREQMGNDLVEENIRQHNKKEGERIKKNYNG